MLNEAAELIAAFRGLEGCSTDEAIWVVVRTRMARLGISAVMVTKGPQVQPFSREMIAYGDPPANVIARIEANAAGGRVSKRLMLRSLEPILLSRGSRAARASKVAAWYETLRRLLSQDAIFVVPVGRKDTVAWIAIFAGKADVFNLLVRSLLNVLVHAAHARAQVLADSHYDNGQGARLSVRERASLSLIAKGKTLTEIGRLLKISPRTVRFHLDNARTKLGVVTRVQAVREALRQSIIHK